MNYRYSLCLVLLLSVLGCIPPYTGPKTSNYSPLEVTISGINKHSAYPDDVVFLHICDPNTNQETAFIKFTTDITQKTINLDNNTSYILRFSSIEPHFGGHTSCISHTYISPMPGESYKITYTTRKESCSSTLMKSTNGNQFAIQSTDEGRVGGVQFTAKVVRR